MKNSYRSQEMTLGVINMCLLPMSVGEEDPFCDVYGYECSKIAMYTMELVREVNVLQLC